MASKAKTIKMLFEIQQWFVSFRLSREKDKAVYHPKIVLKVPVKIPGIPVKIVLTVPVKSLNFLQPKMFFILEKSTFFLSLLFLLINLSTSLPTNISDCIVDGQECKLTGENLLSVTKNVTSIEQCAKVWSCRWWCLWLWLWWLWSWLCWKFSRNGLFDTIKI